ncbi:MAG: Holliday junction branch migration protein RuvA [Defluviitaleaceae bacterium]|nr:Holliday junction branch migration protein RuvA [Defluviitaleaceae bacterium]MCL2273926.1 Holliday junction branch migration protein RuvA [Defluviitaleaceae bacterium]
MIAYVKGALAYTTEAHAVIDVCGLGLQVQASPATLSRLPAKGTEVQLFTYLQLSENGQALHGFLTREEVRIFTLLIAISGIGPKVATAILGTLAPDQLIIAVMAEDATALSKAPGVGKKTAQRIVLELRDKVKTEDAWASEGGAVSSPALPVGGSAKQDAMDALLTLGYGRAEAMQAVMEIAEDDMKAEQIIKLALKKLAR